METGFSERFPELEADAHMWLLGTHNITQVVVSVAFSETFPPPGLSNPLEEALINSVNKDTDYDDLTDSLVELYRAGNLRKPLVGFISARMHLFRRNAPGTSIEVFFDAPVIPADPVHAYWELSMQGILSADLALGYGLIPGETIKFALEDLRKSITRQIPSMEEGRAMVSMAMGLQNEKGSGYQ